MIEDLLRQDVQDYINKVLDEPINKLALSKNPFPTLDWGILLEQIAAKQKSKTKLPTWFQTSGIVFPSKVSVEQTSSERTAQFKSQLISGQSLIDMTGGFGVDDYFFAQHFQQVVHCEMNAELSQKVSHNFVQLKQDNIETCFGDSFEVLKKRNQQFDWMYVDPSRRHDAKGKVFLLSDCLPNVPELQEQYFEYTKGILVKTAPLLDISAALSELNQVQKVFVIALENEVKELLFLMVKGFTDAPTIEAINMVKDKIYRFEHPLQDADHAVFGLPQKYLYEPNAALMKSGLFHAIGQRFGLSKLHQHSHLYTSETLVADFPGRIFEIQQQLPYNKKTGKEVLQGMQTNLSMRNFPGTVEELKRKWKMKDGSNTYTFATTTFEDEKIILICHKL